MRLINNLKTARLVIKEHLPSDLLTMHKLFSNKKAMYYIQDIMTNSIEETRMKLDDAILEIDKIDRKKYFFRIELQNGTYIGEIGFTVKIECEFGNLAELGYFILENYWGNGFVYEAAKAVIDYAFKELNIYKIETGCIKDNSKSENIMIKLGMKKEADKIKHVYHDKALKDRVEYGILRSEWKLI